MKRTALLAFAFACAIGLAARAGTWFDANISQYASWPADATKASGGTWAADNAGHTATLSDVADVATAGVLDIDAAEGDELLFNATNAKTVGDDSITISSSVTFYAFPEADLPAVPTGAKAGIIAVRKTGTDDIAFFALAKNTDGDANVWTELASATPISIANPVSVVVAFVKDGDDTFVNYTVAGQALTLEDSANIPVVLGAVATVSQIAYAGAGQLSSLSAESTGLYVAQVGSEKFATFAEAVEAAAGTETITLLQDAEYTPENTTKFIVSEGDYTLTFNRPQNWLYRTTGTSPVTYEMVKPGDNYVVLAGSATEFHKTVTEAMGDAADGFTITVYGEMNEDFTASKSGTVLAAKGATVTKEKTTVTLAKDVALTIDGFAVGSNELDVKYDGTGANVAESVTVQNCTWSVVDGASRQNYSCYILANARRLNVYNNTFSGQPKTAQLYVGGNTPGYATVYVKGNTISRMPLNDLGWNPPCVQLRYSPVSFVENNTYVADTVTTVKSGMVGFVPYWYDDSKDCSNALYVATHNDFSGANYVYGVRKMEYTNLFNVCFGPNTLGSASGTHGTYSSYMNPSPDPEVAEPQRYEGPVPYPYAETIPAELTFWDWDDATPVATIDGGVVTKYADVSTLAAETVFYVKPGVGYVPPAETATTRLQSLGNLAYKYVNKVFLFYIADKGSFETAAEALKAAEDGDTVQLLADYTIGGTLAVAKALTFDLNGKTLTVATDDVLTANAALTVVNTVAGVGGLAVEGTIQANADVNIRALPYAAGGLIPDGKGGVKIANGANVSYPSTWDGASAGFMEKQNPKLVDAAVGGMVTFGRTYTKTAAGWTFDGMVATADIKTPYYGYEYTEGYATIDAAIANVKPNGTITLVDDITTDKADQWTLDKSMTFDFADKTIDKTVANHWVFRIADGADVIFTGTTGGIVHKPASKNQVNPASMIQIFGKLTVNGGTYESDFTIFKVDEEGPTKTAAGELVVNDGTFTITDEPNYTGLTFAVMNWSKATINGGTWDGPIVTRSCDANVVSQAGTTEITKDLGENVEYRLQVGYDKDTTYANVPKIKGVDLADVVLTNVVTITDTLMLKQDDPYVTVAQAAVCLNDGTEDTYYLTLKEAIDAISGSGGEFEAKLLKDVSIDTLITLHLSKVTLDLNGKTLTVASSVTPGDMFEIHNTTLKVVNSVSGQGGLAIAGIVGLANAELDLYELKYGAGGLIASQGGSLKFYGNSSVTFMKDWENYSPNFLAALNPGFIRVDDPGNNTIETADSTFRYDGDQELWMIEDANVKAKVSTGGFAYIDTFSEFGKAIANATDDATITVFGEADAGESFELKQGQTLDVTGAKLCQHYDAEIKGTLLIDAAGDNYEQDWTAKMYITSTAVIKYGSTAFFGGNAATFTVNQGTVVRDFDDVDSTYTYTVSSDSKLTLNAAGFPDNDDEYVLEDTTSLFAAPIASSADVLVKLESGMDHYHVAETATAGVYALAIDQFEITFKDWDDSTLKVVTNDWNTMPVAPADPVRTGYTFTGWDPEIVAAEADATYTAQYEAKTITVTFVTNLVTYATASYTYGDDTFENEPAKPEGVTKWYTDVDCTIEWTFNGTATEEDYSVYATISAGTQVIIVDEEGNEKKVDVSEVLETAKSGSEIVVPQGTATVLTQDEDTKAYTLTIAGEAKTFAPYYKVTLDEDVTGATGYTVEITPDQDLNGTKVAAEGDTKAVVKESNGAMTLSVPEVKDDLYYAVESSDDLNFPILGSTVGNWTKGSDLKLSGKTITGAAPEAGTKTWFSRVRVDDKSNNID